MISTHDRADFHEATSEILVIVSCLMARSYVRVIVGTPCDMHSQMSDPELLVPSVLWGNLAQIQSQKFYAIKITQAQY